MQPGPTQTGPRRPAEPGMALAEVETPALLIDRAALDANIAALSTYLRGCTSGIRLRAHAKAHKSPDIARLQLAAGAVGVCCQTVAEAEAMVAAGIPDVLLSNQIADASKAARLAVLANTARITACVDGAAQVALLAAAARDAGVILHVLVEIDVGGHRCGVASPEAARDLALEVARHPELAFEGLQAYQNRAQHLRAYEERRDAIAAAARIARQAADLIRESGLPCGTITGAGTGSFEHEAASNLYTELQCGSYVLMDADYARNRRGPNNALPEFAHALSLLTTVISTPEPARVVCDAGLKAMSLDSGPPSLARHPGLAYGGASDEHSTLLVDSGAAPMIGDKLQLLPGHCDPTVAMHDWLVVHDGQVVTALWPVARGR
jgi:D-serine deaminase-like pyridoxal phosphate-dependent protein